MLLAMKSFLLEEIEDAGPASDITPLYIAFSPNNPKSGEYAKALSEGMTRLRKSGKTEAIMQQYGLKTGSKFRKIAAKLKTQISLELLKTDHLIVAQETNNEA